MYFIVVLLQARAQVGAFSLRSEPNPDLGHEAPTLPEYVVHLGWHGLPPGPLGSCIGCGWVLGSAMLPMVSPTRISNSYYLPLKRRLPKTGYLDIHVDSGLEEAEVERLVDLDALLVETPSDRGRLTCVMRDPEGNELCLH
jgi:hypothetical protein